MIFIVEIFLYGLYSRTPTREETQTYCRQIADVVERMLA